MGHSLETREKIRAALIGRPLSPEHAAKSRRARLGRKNSPEHVEKSRLFHLGRKRPSETGQRISQANMGRKVSDETRAKQREAALNRAPDSIELREKRRQNRLKQKLPVRDTSIECLLREEFKKRCLRFEMHLSMFGRFQPDFIFEKARLIVQADGDYWHGSEECKLKDAKFNRLAEEQGWTVWRFSEQVINSDAAACARAVARFVRSLRP